MNNYYMMVDTETANGLEDPFVYDIGIAVIDENGNPVHTESFVIYEIFVKERELMQSAYYASKLPRYQEDINNGSHRLVRFATARKIIMSLAYRFKIKAFIAHNMRFDYNSLNTTLRFLTNSRERFFFPYNIPIWCTLTMSRQTIGQAEEYRNFSQSLYNNSKVSLKAEDLYRYLINDKEYTEEHTGLEDALIEGKIFAACVKIDKNIQKCHYKGGDTPRYRTKNSPLQKRINEFVRTQKAVTNF